MDPREERAGRAQSPVELELHVRGTSRLASSAGAPIRICKSALEATFADCPTTMQVARFPPSRKHRVARDIITRDLPGSLDYARRTGIRYGLLMGLAPLTNDEAILYDVTAGTEEPLAMTDVIAHVDAVLARARHMANDERDAG